MKWLLISTLLIISSVTCLNTIYAGQGGGHGTAPTPTPRPTRTPPVRHNPPPTRTPPVRAAEITINSNPAGCTVLLDEKPFGTTDGKGVLKKPAPLGAHSFVF